MHRPSGPPDLADDVLPDAPVASDDVKARVRRFAAIRAAQRALNPSSTKPIDEGELGVIRHIREQLSELASRLETEPSPLPIRPDEIQSLDGALDGFEQTLLTLTEGVPLSQLRASLSKETPAQRGEVEALLRLCLDSEPVPSRFLRVVDLLITLLCIEINDGRWMMAIDPANLNDQIRDRCTRSAIIDSSVEARIVGRFQSAAERVVGVSNASEVMKDISGYKADVASFYFVPAILRCIVGYNVAARNHFEDRVQRDRMLDAEIEDELDVFEGPGARGILSDDNALAPHEAPGVLAVQEAIRRRLVEDERDQGPAERIAARLDLSWLERGERSALILPSDKDTQRVIRMAVVLGHLAMSHPHCRDEFVALGLHEAQLDGWICRLGEEVQAKIDILIRENEYDGAIRLGDTKSRFLAAVLLVAKRRLGRRGSGSIEGAFEEDAKRLLREQLEREQFKTKAPLFHDLLGGGWRRTAVISSVCVALLLMLVVELAPSNHARVVDEFERSRVRDLSPVLASGYRDHADERSMFVGTLQERWSKMSRDIRRRNADAIQARMEERGVHEVLLFDANRVLQAHFFEGEWRTARAWEH